MMYWILVSLVVISGCSSLFFTGDLLQILLLSISTLLPFPYDSGPLIIPRTSESADEKYDFIIVGSGSAGSVVANRLSEVGTWNILLLEAGYPENSIAQYPGLASLLQFTDYNWDYTTEPQDNICLAMEKQRCAWPRGKALGGSSVINYMIYTRGNPEDYSRWALGNPGWSYSDVLPYFLKSENSSLTSSNEAYHNKSGYQHVGDAFQSDYAKSFLEAGQELGYKLVDYNSPDVIGFSRVQGTTKRGRRDSVARAFLKPILQRTNLRILTGARVIKILIDPATKTAYGVKYNRKGKTFSTRARKEVIICAGALNSPQLLMLSGIGPKKHLEELEIASISDLPVGQTLYDHMAFIGLVFLTNKTIDSVTTAINPLHLLAWHETGDGPLSSLSGVEALGFIKTNVSIEKGNYPDVEIIFCGEGGIHTDYGVISRKTLQVTDEYFNQMYSPIAGNPGFFMFPMLLHPKSKGYLKLRSSNPYDTPLFYNNYFTDPEGHDLKTLVAGIRFIIRMSETEAFKKFNTSLYLKPFVGCGHYLYNSDAYWKCALRYLTVSVHHQTTTCKMGPITDPTTTVVDHSLQVHGVKNLRIADTSVIPISLSAHTHAPTIMVGEKASDLIKKHWKAF